MEAVAVPCGSAGVALTPIHPGGLGASVASNLAAVMRQNGLAVQVAIHATLPTFDVTPLRGSTGWEMLVQRTAQTDRLLVQGLRRPVPLPYGRSGELLVLPPSVARAAATIARVLCEATAGAYQMRAWGLGLLWATRLPRKAVVRVATLAVLEPSSVRAYLDALGLGYALAPRACVRLSREDAWDLGLIHAAGRVPVLPQPGPTVVTL